MRRGGAGDAVRAREWLKEQQTAHQERQLLADHQMEAGVEAALAEAGSAWKRSSARRLFECTDDGRVGAAAHCGVGCAA